MTIASFIISIFALLVAAGSMIYGRGQKLAAERSARAAEGSLQLQQQAERRAAEAEERRKVDWELEWVSGSKYLLCNKGTDSAYDVRVDLKDLGVAGADQAHFPEFRAGAKYKYLLAITLGTKADSMTLTWHQKEDLSDEMKTIDLLVEN